MDMKRVLDLSPERIKAIRMNDPDLAVLEEGALAKSLAYWEELDRVSQPRLHVQLPMPWEVKMWLQMLHSIIAWLTTMNVRTMRITLILLWLHDVVSIETLDRLP